MSYTLSQYDIYTSASDEEILRAFDRAFTERPSFLQGLFSLSKKNTLQRARKWQRVQPTEPEAVREYELVDAGNIERMASQRVGSISGSRIALAIDPAGSSPRAAVYAPRYKTGWGGLLNQFSSDFKAFSKIVVANMKESDPAARMERG